jgi:beta-lactamase superfamily II metal-dependent hydrolase
MTAIHSSFIKATSPKIAIIEVSDNGYGLSAEVQS